MVQINPFANILPHQSFPHMVYVCRASHAILFVHVFCILYTYSFKNAQYDNIEGGDHDENNAVVDHDENEFEANQDP